MNDRQMFLIMFVVLVISTLSVYNHMNNKNINLRTQLEYFLNYSEVEGDYDCLMDLVETNHQIARDYSVHRSCNWLDECIEDYKYYQILMETSQGNGKVKIEFMDYWPTDIVCEEAKVMGVKEMGGEQ